MNRYAAFIGHQPAMSTAELLCAFADAHMLYTSKEVVLFETSEDIDQEAFERLGGTVTIAKQITNNTVGIDDIPSLLATEVEDTKGKITFCIRSHKIAPKVITDLYRNCKMKLKGMGRPCRYVGNEKRQAATALLHDEGLIDGSGGVEITVIQEESGIWVGRTVGAQNPDDYTKRDMDKPVRDTTVGLLPPKLAQMMLNFGWYLADNPDTMTVLDPFCGTGVIPLECLLRGFPIIASDKAQKAVDGTTTNIEWMREEEGIGVKKVPSAVFKHDACKPIDFSDLSEKVLKAGPHVVVTETTLGPNLRKRANATEAKALRKDNEELQAAFLNMAAETLPGVPLVVMWPVWYVQSGPLFLDKIWSVAEKLGYDAVLPDGIESHAPDRNSLLYRRPEQFVGREVVLLRPR